MSKLFDMLARVGYVGSSASVPQPPLHPEQYCKYHRCAGHDIDDCWEFHEEVESMLTLGMLRIEAKSEQEVDMLISEQEKAMQTESCHYQDQGELLPPKLVFKAPVKFQSKSYQTVPFNYGYQSHNGGLAPVMRPSNDESANVGNMTRSGRCYTPEELEKQRKTKAKEVEDPAKGII